MPENGHVTRQVVTAYAREVDAELAIWIEEAKRDDISVNHG